MPGKCRLRNDPLYDRGNMAVINSGADSAGGAFEDLILVWWGFGDFDCIRTEHGDIIKYSEIKE